MPIVVVDLSYMLFYCYYASRKRHIGLTAMVGEKLRRIRNILVPERIYLARDCKRSDIWRNAHIDNYKGTRPSKQDGVKEAMDNFHRTFCLPADVRMVQCATAEADDIVGVIVKDQHADRSVCIVGADNDYLQLNDMCHIYEFTRNGLRRREIADSGRVSLLKKIILGDKSDNIAKLMPGVGPKTLDAMLLKLGYEGVLAEAMKDPGFARNRLVIDMDMIPEALVSAIKASFLKCVNENNAGDHPAKTNKTDITNYFAPRRAPDAV